MNIQPVTSLIIRASLPEMTRVLLGACDCLLCPGSPTPGCTLVKKHPAGHRLGIQHLAFIFLSLSARHVHGQSSTWCGMAHPSRAASRPPKVRRNLRAGHERISHAHVITGYGQNRQNKLASCP